MSHDSINHDSSRYTAEGYCVFPRVLSELEIDAAPGQLDELIATMPERIVVYRDGENKEVAARPEYRTEPHAKHSFWLELCRHAAVPDAVESVLGPDLTLIMSHLIVKPPNDGLPVAWHQDNTMHAGSLSVHDSYVLHGSDANTSGRRRAAYTMRYANAKTVAVDTDEHCVPVYLVRGSGSEHENRYIDIRPTQPLPRKSD